MHDQRRVDRVPDCMCTCVLLNNGTCSVNMCQDASLLCIFTLDLQTGKMKLVHVSISALYEVAIFACECAAVHKSCGHTVIQCIALNNVHKNCLKSLA